MYFIIPYLLFISFDFTFYSTLVILTILVGRCCSTGTARIDNNITFLQEAAFFQDIDLVENNIIKTFFFCIIKRPYMLTQTQLIDSVFFLYFENIQGHDGPSCSA